ncbi:hypothetical protein CPB84DRAFT_1743804 [Gymnopilus junonius]|uniref:Uncharacterized protein n=1 Tax=Gymnopilus junonius TaxID=109634 RepID=A0A9P5P050_GYMJU|nr:hypothetical protein CPB84DRAFT_1743804 [Gymnopilus junonius]
MAASKTGQVNQGHGGGGHGRGRGGISGPASFKGKKSVDMINSKPTAELKPKAAAGDGEVNTASEEKSSVISTDSKPTANTLLKAAAGDAEGAEKPRFHTNRDSHPDSAQGKKIILKKADDALTTWHNKIGQMTITYMENNLIWELPDMSLEYISTWCHWALDGDFKSHPFYYKEYLDPGAEGNEGNEKPLKLNIFCHSIIACMLGYHLGCLLPIPTHLKSAQLPSGALITAIQSAYCAITHWSSGTYITPGCPFSDFSGDNWGDSNKCNPSDFPATLPKYTVQGKKPMREIKRIMQKLSQQQWEDILAEAHQFANTKGKKRARSSSGDNTTLEAAIVKLEEESDFEIEDDAADATGSTNEG